MPQDSLPDSLLIDKTLFYIYRTAHMNAKLSLMSKRTEKILLLFLALPLLFLSASHAEGQVKIWEALLSLPTYEPKAPDKNPMFYVPAAYQGAKRVIYPYPLIDNLSTEKTEVKHRAVYLENEFIKLCLLPDIGGRLFYATDKTNNYEIFYRQHVI